MPEIRQAKVCDRCGGNGREPVFCGFTFKSKICGYTGKCTTCDKTFQDCIDRNNLPNFGGFPSLEHCKKCDGTGMM